uniref:Uncharacterized protein n=1 Tax=Arundo donax TaxID=35708 RepID=A0A0A8Y882_ARUDO
MMVTESFSFTFAMQLAILYEQSNCTHEAR